MFAWDIQFAEIAAKSTSAEWKNCEFYITSEKEDNLLGTTKFSKNFAWKCPFHLIFILEFPKFSVQWFAFRNFDNFRIFWTFPRKLPYHLSKISKWKAPNVSKNKGPRMCIIMKRLPKKSVETSFPFQSLFVQKFWSQNCPFAFAIVPCDTIDHHIPLTSVNRFDRRPLPFCPYSSWGLHALMSYITQTVTQGNA